MKRLVHRSVGSLLLMGTNVGTVNRASVNLLLLR